MSGDPSWDLAINQSKITIIPTGKSQNPVNIIKPNIDQWITLNITH